MSQISDKEAESITHKVSEQCLPFIGQMVGKLIGINSFTTISFENFEVDVPIVHDSNGQQIGGGKFMITGSITMSTELRSNGNDDVTINCNNNNGKKVSIYED